MSEAKIRLDKWLWHARFFKTRTLPSKVVSGGHVRVNANKVSKPGTTVVADAVQNFPQRNHIRVIKLVKLGIRRGPASEAQTLYDHLRSTQEKIPQEQSQSGGARPTK